MPEAYVSRVLEAEIAQGWMIVWTGAQGPVVLALFCSDRQIVDAGNSSLHQAVDIEFPVLIAVAAKPIEAVVVPLVSKAHRNPVLRKAQISLIRR